MSLIQELYIDLLSYYNHNFRALGLQNPFFCRNGDELTWHANKGVVHADSYDEHYEWVVENNQYSLQLWDESCIQAYYCVRGNSVLRASLAYLPSGSALVTGKGYVRFDCDISASKHYFHTAYHAHFGHGSEMRISILQFPLPSQFIDFVLTVAYNLERPVSAPPDRRQIPTLDDLKCSYSAFLSLATR